ncbi:DNA-binding LytR/AlgR family response regulator [Dyadobacter jejuensis]|uniref:DNA-binding LytR/AlgR family response regulator n=1 Tax=Dyadobacter jejuensis TaxID=1082580 RepID=A0A316A9U5_9BACT|nr:response regulator transcription factor [Dyadobacter jejuensis]PWJ54282.1 DNA-binding LytR/AlgR family response regulator [Dyadobacter jejuensis]
MKILIVEDEVVIAKHLQYTLKGFGYSNFFLAGDYHQALEILNKEVIHLALLDISLGGYKTGIDLAEYIRARYNFPFIFLTSHEELAIVNAALNTSPNAFLNKPFKNVSVYTAVSLAMKNYKENSTPAPVEQDQPAKEESIVIQDALFIKEKNIFSKIFLDQILFIRSDDNYLELHTPDRKYTIRETLKNMISQLPDNQFFRTHKSYIVNLNAITGINHIHLMINDIEIPITADNRSELFKKLNTFT